MGNKINIVSSIHNSTPRNYIKRMMTSKVSAMKIARKFGKDYLDGKRMYGYGGYKYIEN